jgi:hypothetical protein
LAAAFGFNASAFLQIAVPEERPRLLLLFDVSPENSSRLK